MTCEPETRFLRCFDSTMTTVISQHHQFSQCSEYNGNNNTGMCTTSIDINNTTKVHLTKPCVLRGSAPVSSAILARCTSTLDLSSPTTPPPQRESASAPSYLCGLSPHRSRIAPPRHVLRNCSSATLPDADVAYADASCAVRSLGDFLLLGDSYCNPCLPYSQQGDKQRKQYQNHQLPQLHGQDSGVSNVQRPVTLVRATTLGIRDSARISKRVTWSSQLEHRPDLFRARSSVDMC
eukprot:c240_g1_i1.p1 GENE.c240_g1_i1~~c240_g1_i1.p1  ORF type:complete len:263 (+),score=45.90 c240_g1_i1:83-790(+)